MISEWTRSESAYKALTIMLLRREPKRNRHLPKWTDNENTTLNVKNDITNWSVISAHFRWTVTEKPLTMPSLTILTSYTSFSDSKGYLTHIDWQWRIIYTPFRDRLLSQSENLQINSTYKKQLKQYFTMGEDHQLARHYL